MEIIQQLSLVAFHQVLGDRADSIISFLDDRFSDNGQRLTRAVHTANVRAWKSLEIALAGSSWWNSCKGLLSSRAEQNFRKQVQGFLETVPLPALPDGQGDFRDICLRELKAAAKARLIPGDDVPTDALARQARALAERATPENLLRAEFEAVEGMALGLQQAGYTALARYASLRPEGSKPLLVVGVRFFFRREVELDPKLSAGLTFQQLEGLSASQEAGFRDLGDALHAHGERLEELLDNVTTIVTDTNARVAETQEDVQDLKAEVRRLSEMLTDRAEATGSDDESQALRAQLEQQSKQIQELMSFVARAVEQRQEDPPPAPVENVPTPEPPVPPPETPVPEVPSAARGFAPPAPPEPPPPPVTDTPAVTGGVGWDQVRQLLGQAQSLTRDNSGSAPELFQAVDQLERATRQYETTRQTILKLADTREAEPIAKARPVFPREPEAPSEAPSTLRRVKGSLVSSLFEAPPKGEEKAPPEPAEPEPGRPTSKLLSPLFQQPPAEPETEEGEKKEAPPKKRGRGLSPLFGGPTETDEPTE